MKKIIIVCVSIIGIVILLSFVLKRDELKTQSQSTQENKSLTDQQTSKINTTPNQNIVHKDWIDYRNDTLGFSFKYPKDFSVTDFSINVGGTGEVIAMSFDKANEQDYSKSFFFVAVSKDYVPPQEPAYLATNGWNSEFYSKEYILGNPIQGINTTIHIIRSKNPRADEYCEGCPGLGYKLGAIVNAKNKYPGIMLSMPDDEISKQILSTISIY